MEPSSPHRTTLRALSLLRTGVAAVLLFGLLLWRGLLSASDALVALSGRSVASIQKDLLATEEDRIRAAMGADYRPYRWLAQNTSPDARIGVRDPLLVEGERHDQPSIQRIRRLWTLLYPRHVELYDEEKGRMLGRFLEGLEGREVPELYVLDLVSDGSFPLQEWFVPVVEADAFGIWRFRGPD